MLVIHDEELVRQLQALAEQQQRPVEEVLRSFLNPNNETSTHANIDEKIGLLKAKLYGRARSYWRENGNLQRAELSDKTLDREFWGFDTNGVPYLNIDIDEAKPPHNPLLNLAFALTSRRKELTFSERGIIRRSREILNSEFADYILNRSKRHNDKS
jgi:hypothetical protein